MTFKEVCDYWVADLTANVGGLAPPTITHRYAPWSPELLYSERSGERHLAVYPELDAETAVGLTVIGDRLGTQTYALLVWENATDSQGRLVENVDRDAAWLLLAEQVKDRVMDRDGVGSGTTTVMSTQYAGTTFQRTGEHRVFTVEIVCAVPHVAT